MKARFCFTIACGAALLLLASCKSNDDDPFADISTTKKPPAEEKQKKSGSLLDQLDFSGSERAKRKARHLRNIRASAVQKPVRPQPVRNRRLRDFFGRNR